MPSGELDTSGIVRSILQSGKTLFVPRIDRGRGEMDMLKIFDEYDLNHLPSGTWGIKEPELVKDGVQRPNAMDPDSPMLDLILLPGVAFDSALSRLGHGKGYYDRFLSSYHALIAQSFKMPVLCVYSARGYESLMSLTTPLPMGLALSPQLLNTAENSVPIGDYDWKVDGVISPGGLVGKPEEQIVDSSRPLET